MSIRKWTPPVKVAALRLARSRKRVGFHEYIVAYPIKPGPQVCIIRSTKAPYQTILQVEDALVVLPISVPRCKGFPYPEFAAYLAIANQQYKQDIKSAQGNPKIKALAKRSWKSAPFARRKGARVQYWEPYTLNVGDVRRNKRWKEHWWIASRWTDWEMQRMTRAERFEEHSWNQGKMPPTDPGVRRKAIQRFRGMCRTMNLPKSQFL